jgi:hypothetical protein
LEAASDGEMEGHLDEEETLDKTEQEKLKMQRLLPPW